MKINFYKMNGAGNDFILIDDENFTPEPGLIQKMCDRHFGIGADGVLWIRESSISDFSISYFNSDGTGDALCINGARCAVLYAYSKNLTGKTSRFDFIGKVFEAEVLDDNDIKVLLDYSPEFMLRRNIEFHSKLISVAYFDLGSKHIVIDWDEFKSDFQEEFKLLSFDDFDVNLIGKELRLHPSFQPDGVNINFINKIYDRFYKIRTYERGVEAETLACGSGSIASAMFIFLMNKDVPPVELQTRGSKILKINFEFSDNSFKNISLIGPAEKVFEGVIDL